jgi:serine/threonine-protein kinase
LDESHWRRAEKLFLDTLDLGVEERAAYLNGASADDPELRATVERMLDADSRTTSWLDGGPARLADLLDEDERPAPAYLGPYEIVHPIGRGGMSTVFLARRADGSFDRDVALKMFQSGFDSDAHLRRFRSEAQFLARFEHPNIARLYDAGVDDGVAYLVLEYVQGERIDAYCGARDLGIEGRLEVFMEVCGAVQHAHQNLIIHRDLKPSNILVSGDGVVKLLDFGISGLIQPGGSDSSEAGTGVRALTPEYASPEQRSGSPVTTASDVYSLGVVLHELLTGERPGPGAPRTSFRAAELRGDLDAILDRALQADPAHRYPSPQSLLDDLRRHIDHRPVQARPGTPGYHLAKFARRNRVGVAAGATVFLSLVGGLGMSLWQATVAAEQRDLARREAEKATRVTDFLIGVFEVADPALARADTLTAAQILDRGARRIETDLASEPQIQATMFDVIGRVYASLSLYEPADSLLRRGLESRLEALGPEHPEVAQSRTNLANLSFLRSDGTADSLYREIVTLRRRTLEPDDPRLGESLVGLAFSLLGHDDREAEAALDEAMRIYEAGSAPPSQVADAVYARGFLHHSEGRYAEAEREYRKALTIQRPELGPTHPKTLTTLSNLGSLLRLVARYEAADSALHAVLAARRAIYGPRHSRVANSLVALAELSLDRGDYAATRAYVTEALDLRTTLFGRGHPSVTYTSFLLARTLQAEGDLEGAAALLEPVLEAAGTDGLGAARAVNDFAVNLEARGDIEGAEAFYRQAWGLYGRALGDDHPFTAIVEGNVASMRLEQGDLVAAEPMLRSALATLTASYGEEHPSVAVVRLLMGTVDLLAGRPERAEAALRMSLDVFEAKLPPDHWRIGQARLRLGAAVADQGRLTEADRLLRSSRQLLEPRRRARPGDWRQLVSELLEVSTALGHADDAATYRALFEASEALLPKR